MEAGTAHRLLNLLNPGASERILPTKVTMDIRGGDVLRHVTAGGGGFGDPFRRDPALVLADYANGKVSAAHARQAYGVVVDDAGAVDAAATDRLRAERHGPGT